MPGRSEHHAVFAPEWREIAAARSKALRGRWLIIGGDGWLRQGIVTRGPDAVVTTLSLREAASALGAGGFVSGLPDAIVFRWTSEAATLGDRVVIFSGRPARIRKILEIPLPRPRDLNDPEVATYAGEILKELEDEDASR